MSVKGRPSIWRKNSNFFLRFSSPLSITFLQVLCKRVRPEVGNIEHWSFLFSFPYWYWNNYNKSSDLSRDVWALLGLHLPRDVLALLGLHLSGHIPALLSLHLLGHVHTLLPGHLPGHVVTLLLLHLGALLVRHLHRLLQCQHVRGDFFSQWSEQMRRNTRLYWDTDDQYGSVCSPGNSY